MQQLAFGEIIRQGFRLLEKNILQIITIGTKLHRADLAETEVGNIFLAQGFHKAITIILNG